jgi:signal transduction histidine kinase
MSSAGPTMPERARRRHGGAHVSRRRAERPRPVRVQVADPTPATDGLGRRIAGWLPHGRGLPTEDWAARHALMCWVLALHLPAIVGYALWRQLTLTHGLVAASPPLLLFAAAVVPGARRVRALAASLGLLCCSVVLVHLSDGLTHMYFHFFVVVALVALYEDWSVYLLAFVFVFISNLVIVNILSAVARHRIDNTWASAGINAGFIVALAGAQLVFWHYNEQSRRRVEHYRQLYEGQQSLMARLEETDKIRSDLVATVSHEFRTPLTGIRGTLLTIKRRRSRMSEAQLDDMIDSAVNYSDRLSRLLENMLTAATATGTDETTIADLPEVVREVLATLSYSGSTNSVTVDLPPELPVRMARQALSQVVANLVDNALVHSWPGAPVRLIAGRVGDEVVLRVRNPGPDLDPATISQLFEPFTQRDGSATRQTDGAGMGLYVVRRLVEVHGGRLRMASENGEIIVEVDLWAAALPQPQTRPSSMPSPAQNLPAPRGLREPGVRSLRAQDTPPGLSGRYDSPRRDAGASWRGDGGSLPLDRLG